MAVEQAHIEIEAEEIEKDQYLVFVVTGQEYAIQAMNVKEISRVLPTTKVPTAPQYIEGILNLRGQLATVIDFRRKFGLQAKEQDEDTRIIIIEHGGFPIGLIVDSVEEVLKIPDENIQKMPEETTTPVSKEYITGIGMLEKRLVVILNVDKLLSKSEVFEISAARQAVAGEEMKKAG